MQTARRSFRTRWIILFSLLASGAAYAQTARPEGQSPPPSVTASAAADRVRYAALGEVHQTRLQVFSPDGAEAFDSGYRLGNLVTWRLTDRRGSRLADGTYLFLVTVRDFSGNLTQKYGTTLLERGRVYLEQAGKDEMAWAQANALEANRLAAALSPVDRLGAAAIERAGATDAADETAGAGPQATGKGENAPADNIEPSVSGTGTTGRLVKWTNGATGALGNSVVAESNNKIGLRTATPRATLDIKQSADSFIGGLHLRRSTTNDTWGFVTGGDNKLYMSYAASASGADAAADFTIRPLILTPTNRVGIGTADPTAKLHVEGEVNFTGLRTEATAGTPNVIGGNSGNSVTAGVRGATIGGGGASGITNSVTDDLGTVGGGSNNRAGDNAGTTTNASNATVGGGSANKARGFASTVGGGFFNDALGDSSAVGGGSSNTASGNFSAVPGGRFNTAAGSYSLAAGEGAEAFHGGTFVWSDSTSSLESFSSTAANQFLIDAAGGVGIGTNAPAARLHVAGTSSAETTPIVVVSTSGTQMPVGFRSGAVEHARIRADSVGNLVFATLNGSGKDIYFRAGDDSGTDMFVESSNGNVGIGTTVPGAARLKVQGGDVFITQPNSLVITSPNGSCWQIRVTDAGALFAATVACP